jgi:hypothetical protein
MITRASMLSQISALLDDELPEKDALAIKKHVSVSGLLKTVSSLLVIDK